MFLYQWFFSAKLANDFFFFKGKMKKMHDL